MRLAILCALILGVGSVFSATIHVPADQLTIQAGIDAAVNGDTVMVAPGTYRQTFSFSGKGILVKGEKGADSTILTYDSTVTSLIQFENGEDTTSVLRGFTVRDITSEFAVYLYNAFGKISNCRFVNITAYGEGWAAIMVTDAASVVVDSCTFDSCTGAGVASYFRNGPHLGRISDSKFRHNEMTLGDLRGGGIGLGSASMVIERNLFLGNEAGDGAAIYTSGDLGSVIRNNTIVNNTSPNSIIYQWSGSVDSVVNNLFVGNVSSLNVGGGFWNCNSAYTNLPNDILPGENVVVADPLFCDTASGNFAISDASPCAPANNVCGVLIGAFGVECLDTDGDGSPDITDPDDDNDGVLDANDPDDVDPAICGDSDSDGCDDCSVQVDGLGPLPDVDPNNDGADTDADGLCDASDCCWWATGNVDNDPNQFVDIGDLTMLIMWFKGLAEIDCMEEANIDGSIDGLVDIGDITGLIGYLFIPPFSPPAACE